MAYIDEVTRKAQADREEYKKTHGQYPQCQDKRETREEAIARTSAEVNRYIKQLSQVNNER